MSWNNFIKIIISLTDGLNENIISKYNLYSYTRYLTK